VLTTTSDMGTSITYHFCPTCGSTIYWSVEGMYQAVAVGSFVDPAFPAPTMETHTTDRHRWVPPIREAEQHATHFGAT